MPGMERRTLLTAAVWIAPAIASQSVGVAWADHYRRPEDEHPSIGDPCEPVAPFECPLPL